jgi:putative CocE/NonD family hydrolase
MEFGSATGEWFREQVMLPFFEHYLKGKGVDDLPKAYVFETGSNRWEREDAWPVKDVSEKTLYLRAGGKLSFEPPARDEKEFDEYVSDPRNPVPYMDHVGPEFDATYMYGDQRFAAKRGDVLTYVSDVLADDVTVTGPVEPKLQVSTSGTDSDFDVKLIDVYPDGYGQMVRGEPMRAKFRKSMVMPEAMVSGEVTPVSFAMPDVNHRFLRGHRIMVQVQSSWFPLTDLNPQRFMDTAQAGSGDFVKATERVYHSPAAESGLVVRVRAR